MREESQIDAMRSAIRGDFERLAERRGDQDLMRVADEPVESVEPTDGLPAGELGSMQEKRPWFARLGSR